MSSTKRSILTVEKANLKELKEELIKIKKIVNQREISLNEIILKIENIVQTIAAIRLIDTQFSAELRRVAIQKEALELELNSLLTEKEQKRSELNIAFERLKITEDHIKLQLKRDQVLEEYFEEQEIAEDKEKEFKKEED